MFIDVSWPTRLDMPNKLHAVVNIVDCVGLNSIVIKVLLQFKGLLGPILGLTIISLSFK